MHYMSKRQNVLKVVISQGKDESIDWWRKFNDEGSWSMKKFDLQRKAMKVDWQRKLIDKESQLSKKVDLGDRLTDKWTDNTNIQWFS